MEEIIRFVALTNRERFTVTELCEPFGISRKTGDQHLEPYAANPRVRLEPVLQRRWTGTPVGAGGVGRRTTSRSSPCRSLPRCSVAVEFRRRCAACSNPSALSA